MANSFVFANNVSTTLGGAVASGDTTITLADAANLPTMGADQYFVVTLNDAATQAVFEVIYATGISGANLTGCLRGQEGTSAQAWLTGDFAFSGVTEGILASFQQISGGGYVELHPAVAQVGDVSIDGTISATGEISSYSNLSANGTLTVGTPVSVSNGGTGKTTALQVKLAIALGFVSGSVITGADLPAQPVVAYSGGSLTGLRLNCKTSDNVTVFTVYKNGSSIGTITNTTSQPVYQSITPVSIGAGDVLSASVTTAGTAADCALVAEGVQDAT